MCSETFVSRKNRSRERVTKLNREERTPSWLEPGWGHDIHSPSKQNSHVEKLQLSPFTSHRLPVNQGGQSCVFRGSLSPGPGIASPLLAAGSSHAGWGLQLPFTARDRANDPDAAGNPAVALHYSRAKGEDGAWNAGWFWEPWGKVPQGAASLLCHEHLHFPISTVCEFNNTTWRKVLVFQWKKTFLKQQKTFLLYMVLYHNKT